VGDVVAISKLDGCDLSISGQECLPKCLHECQARSVWVPGGIDNLQWWQCVVLVETAAEMAAAAQ
jgi:hypothetical protein